jgi:hypothetical protein
VTLTGGDAPSRNIWGQDGRGNYWDEYRGFDAAGDGVGDVPFRYEGAFDDLTRRNDWVRAYAFTPARNALDLAAKWFPAYRPKPRVVDEHPLMRPLDIAVDGTATTRWSSVGAGLALVVSAAAALVFVRRGQRKGWAA